VYNFFRDMGSLHTGEPTPVQAPEIAFALAQPATPATPAPPADAAGELSFSFADGRGLLSLERRPVSALAVVERLSMEVPGLRLPDELAGGAERFRNRRCRLAGAIIATDLPRIDHELERDDLQARLADAGISDIRASIADGALLLGGRAAMGGREAGFTARVRLEPVGARKLRVYLDDLRVYGFLPLPAPFVAGAILGSAVRARAAADGAAARLGGAPTRATPPWLCDLDPLDTALYEVFAAKGWRLPDAGGVRLTSVEIAADRIALTWTRPEADDAAAPIGLTPASDPELERADDLLARGEVAAALGAYRQMLQAAPDDTVARSRALEILISSPSSLAEADQVARALLTRAPEHRRAMIARAVSAAERGDAQDAAERYEQIATLADRHGEHEDAVAAWLAATDQWLRAQQALRARPLIDRLLATWPGREKGPLARVLESFGRVLVDRGELGEADRVLEARMAIAPDDADAAAVAAERARIRLLGPGGPAAALDVLRDMTIAAAPEDALVLRADLGEREERADDAIPALDELAARARRAADPFRAKRMEDRSRALARRAVTGPTAPLAAAAPGATAADALRDDGGALRGDATAEALEEMLLANPTDAGTAEELAAIYARIADPHERAEALSSLLLRALGLSSDRRKALYADVGESAEAVGDLERAEQAYWRAAAIEAQPEERARFLVSHARVLLARGEIHTAISELEEALGGVPDHAGALALLGDLAFRIQDWPRARGLYALLDGAPGSADVIPRELLTYRRALLAQAVGFDSEAESFFREVAILNPRQIEARQALAELAWRRGDFGGAALRLEEILRLLPFDALDRLLEVRERLGGVYLRLGDWGSARYYIELVLAQDATRAGALEQLVDVYLRLSLPKEAAQACERLSRLYAEPSRRAEVLYRQGEIRRELLGDDAAAVDAYLKASDLDPRFAPALVRLAEHDWRQGAFDDLADIAAELERIGFAPDPQDDVDLVLRLAIGAALAAGEARGRRTLHGITWDAPRAARALAEAASFMGARPPADLDAALALFGGDDDGAAGAAVGVFQALKDLIQDDPTALGMGAARALARLADRQRQTTSARALYSLLLFVDPEDAAGARLGELGAAPDVDARTLRSGGLTDHPGCAGPLREVLRPLAAALLGWKGAGGAAPVEPAGEDASLSPAQADTLRRVAELLQPPPFVAAVARTTAPLSPAGATAPATVAVHGTRPALVAIAPHAATLPERQWAFLAAQALDELRTALAAVRDLTRGEVGALVDGIEAALTGVAGPDHPHTRAARAWLAAPERAGDLPGGEDRARLLREIQALRAAPPDWGTFRHACLYTSQRVALLVCGHPLDALRAIAHDDKLVAGAAAAAGAAARRSLLRTSAVRELVRYALSADYAHVTAEAAPAATAAVPPARAAAAPDQGTTMISQGN
jgi:tetratricopeptide (TPR) repeat protein